MKIIFVSDDISGNDECRRQLERLGHAVVHCINAQQSFAQQHVVGAADFILVKVVELDRSLLLRLRPLTTEPLLPVLLFADRSRIDPGEAISAGVSACVIDGYEVSRIAALVDVAVARFRQLAELRQELKEVKQSLDNRRIIEKAKGIVMQKQGLNEEQAYMLLRKAAMNQSKKLVEVSRSIISLADVLI